METFILWVNSELNKRGWSRSEAARRGGISSSILNKVVGGFANPGLDTCIGLSRAFNVPLEDVFRMAKILPPKAPPRVAENNVVYHFDDRKIERQLLEAFRGLNGEDRERVLDLVLRLAGQVAPHIIGETFTEE